MPINHHLSGLGDSGYHPESRSSRYNTLKNSLAAILVFITPLTANAYRQHLAPNDDPNHHPFYAGVEAGYGSTTWGYLVPPEENVAMSMSTPIAVNEGGAIWGLLLGYELNPNFAVEGSYTHYPNADIYFDDMSLFTFEHHDATEFTTESECVSIISKFMLYIPNTKLRALSSVGIANVHREDMVYDSWTLTPKFGVGFNYDLNSHVMIEIGINYTAGYAISELSPAEDFIPFLYSGYVHLNWRF